MLVGEVVIAQINDPELIWIRWIRWLFATMEILGNAFVFVEGFLPSAGKGAHLSADLLTPTTISARCQWEVDIGLFHASIRNRLSQYRANPSGSQLPTRKVR